MYSGSYRILQVLVFSLIVFSLIRGFPNPLQAPTALLRLVPAMTWPRPVPPERPSF